MRYGELSGLNLRAVKQDNGWTDYHYYVDGVIDEDHYWWYDDIERYSPALVQVVEELGELANGQHAALSIVDVPDDVTWYIDDYDGIETVREEHRSW